MVEGGDVLVSLNVLKSFIVVGTTDVLWTAVENKYVFFLQNKGKTAQVSLKAFRWDADHFSGRQNKGSILRLQK